MSFGVSASNIEDFKSCVCICIYVHKEILFTENFLYIFFIWGGGVGGNLYEI